MALANIHYIDFRGKKYERGLQELFEILRVLPPKEKPTVWGSLPIWGWGGIALVAALVIGGAIFLGNQGGEPTATPTPVPVAGRTTTPAAMVPPTATPVPMVVPTATPYPTDTPTVVPTSSPTHTPVIPTATPTKRAPAMPTATRTPATTPTNSCSFKPGDTFYKVWQAERSRLGCALNELKVFTAEQLFENGFMFWREDRDRFIYVLYNKGTWQSYEGAFREADPEPAGYSPPPGLQEPLLGFGQVWREELGGPNSEIGWATYHELGFPDDRWVDCEHGMMLWSGQWGDLWGIFVLYNDGTWQFK